jgi:hypothetical protein
LRDHQIAMRELTATLGESAVATYEQLLATVQTWIDKATQVAEAYGATKQEIGRGVTATTCIITAGRVVSKGSSPVERLRLEAGIRSVWQRGSADAHGRTWQARTRALAHEREALRVDIGELLNGIQAVTLVLNEAWRVWDLRSLNLAARLG